MSLARAVGEREGKSDTRRRRILWAAKGKVLGSRLQSRQMAMSPNGVETNHTPPQTSAKQSCHRDYSFLFLFSLALQPSAGSALLWLCSPARALPSCGSAAQRGLCPPVALQPSAGYALLWLCSPARAMASSYHEVS
jgi:hypothetical protein